MVISDLLSILRNQNIRFDVRGRVDAEIDGFSSIYHYRSKTLTWLREYTTINNSDFIRPNRISCLITDNSVPMLEFVACQIIVDDPRKVFFYLVENIWGDNETPSISSKASIKDGAIVGEGTSIGDFTTISSQTTIGKDCKIGSNVSIKGKVRIGDRCVIQSGAIIGEDGFAFAKENGHPVFIKHYGGVYIGDDVSIGSCSCVCRGTIEDTMVEDEAKIDNLCHIAHNVVIGKRSIIIAGSVIMGSVHVGNDCWIATSMVRDQKHVGNNVVVGMGAVVVKDVEDGVTVAGNPARPFERKEKI